MSDDDREIEVTSWGAETEDGWQLVVAFKNIESEEECRTLIETIVALLEREAGDAQIH